MHCKINWANEKLQNSYLRCPVPGSIKLPAELRAILKAKWLICTSPGQFWLTGLGRTRGPFDRIPSATKNINLEWGAARIMEDEQTKPTPLRAQEPARASWIICTGDKRVEFSGAAVIGRSEHATLRIPSMGVSQIHAIVFPVKGALHYQDLGSKNGSYLMPNSRIMETTIQDKDEVHIAGHSILFHRGDNAVDSVDILPSVVMAKSRAIVSRVAPTKAPVVITGESGVGKEAVATSIHKQSKQSGPMVIANAACFTPQLARSELFGHRAGSFTGATSDKDGLFIVAHQGTLFLDEIADMALSVQAELLRALETGMVHPVGSNQPVVAKPRIIAATHKDLVKEVSEGRFREDLFYRLFVVNLHVPPLRERPDDIDYLATKFAQTFCDVAELSTDVLQWLRVQTWSGNIRELRNLFWKASVIYPEQPTNLFNLRRLFENKTSKKPCKDEIIEVFFRMDKSIQRTADHLQIHRSTVHRNIRAHRNLEDAAA